MPQVKGRATWLTNQRQGTDTVKALGIDESAPKIENEQVEEAMRRELNEINLQAHRAMADRTHELSQTKRDITNYHRIKKLASLKKPDPVAERQRARLASATDKPPPPQKLGVGMRPQTGMRATTNGFSKVQIDSDSDDDDYYFRLHNAAASSTTALAPRTTAHPSRSRRRPKTVNPARSMRQIRQELQEEFSSSPARRESQADRARRPNTTLGFSRQDPTRDDRDPTREDREPPSAPGRSFNELRDLAHLDRLNSAGMRSHQVYLRQQRDDKIAEEARQLQLKLQRFYERMDSFKRDSQRGVIRSAFLL